MLDEATETSINSEKKIFFVQIDSFPFLSFLHQAWLSPPLMTCTSCSFADKEEERKQWKIDAKLSSPSRMSLKLLRFFSTVFFSYPMHERLHILCKFSSGSLRCDLYVRTKSFEIIEKLSLSIFPRHAAKFISSRAIESALARNVDSIYYSDHKIFNLHLSITKTWNSRKNFFSFFCKFHLIFSGRQLEVEREVGLFTFATKHSRNSLQFSCRVDIHSIYLFILWISWRPESSLSTLQDLKIARMFASRRDAVEKWKDVSVP